LSAAGEGHGLKLIPFSGFTLGDSLADKTSKFCTLLWEMVFCHVIIVRFFMEVGSMAKSVIVYTQPG